jgi:Lrp/AsnC family transcriptional regulator, regulator for asnA, asnC and gidA
MSAQRLDAGNGRRQEGGRSVFAGLRGRRPDETDRRIIAHLQEDGRRPYTTIAKDLGLSEAGVRQRVARLIRNKVIQIVAVSEPMDLGFTRAEVLVEVDGDRVMAVAEALAALPQVDFVAVTGGSYDLNIGLVCSDQDELLDLLVHRIRTISGVRHTELAVYLKVVKDSYEWSPITHPETGDRHREDA